MWVKTGLGTAALGAVVSIADGRERPQVTNQPFAVTTPNPTSTPESNASQPLSEKALKSKVFKEFSKIPFNERLLLRNRPLPITGVGNNTLDNLSLNYQVSVDVDNAVYWARFCQTNLIPLTSLTFADAIPGNLQFDALSTARGSNFVFGLNGLYKAAEAEIDRDYEISSSGRADALDALASVNVSALMFRMWCSSGLQYPNVRAGISVDLRIEQSVRDMSEKLAKDLLAGKAPLPLKIRKVTNPISSPIF